MLCLGLKKSLTSLRLKLTAQGVAYRCSKVGYPGTPLGEHHIQYSTFRTLLIVIINYCQILSQLKCPSILSTTTRQLQTPSGHQGCIKVLVESLGRQLVLPCVHSLMLTATWWPMIPLASPAIWEILQQLQQYLFRQLRPLLKQSTLGFPK